MGDNSVVLGQNKEGSRGTAPGGGVQDDTLANTAFVPSSTRPVNPPVQHEPVVGATVPKAEGAEPPTTFHRVPRDRWPQKEGAILPKGINPPPATTTPVLPVLKPVSGEAAASTSGQDLIPPEGAAKVPAQEVVLAEPEIKFLEKDAPKKTRSPSQQERRSTYRKRGGERENRRREEVRHREEGGHKRERENYKSPDGAGKMKFSSRECGYDDRNTGGGKNHGQSSGSGKNHDQSSGTRSGGNHGQSSGARSGGYHGSSSGARDWRKQDRTNDGKWSEWKDRG